MTYPIPSHCKRTEQAHLCIDTFLTSPQITCSRLLSVSTERNDDSRAEKHSRPQCQLPSHLHRLPHHRLAPGRWWWRQQPSQQLGDHLRRLRHHLLLCPLSSLPLGPQVTSEIPKLVSRMRKCGIRCCLVLGGSLYTVYCSQLFFPSLALQYSCSVLLGAGAAILWTAQVTKWTLHQPSLQNSKSEIQPILRAICWLPAQTVTQCRETAGSSGRSSKSLLHWRLF